MTTVQIKVKFWFQLDDQKAPTVKQVTHAIPAITKIVTDEFKAAIRHGVSQKGSPTIRFISLSKLQPSKSFIRKQTILRGIVTLKLPRNVADEQKERIIDHLSSIDDDGNHPVKMGKYEYLLQSKAKWIIPPAVESGDSNK